MCLLFFTLCERKRLLAFTNRSSTSTSSLLCSGLPKWWSCVRLILLTMKNRSQLHYNLAPVLYILNIELVKTNYRDIILNKTIKLPGIFRGKIDASMRTTCKISVTTKVRLPVCIMKANSSIEWHPVRYRLFIRIGSICCHFTSQHGRTALWIQCEYSRGCFSTRISGCKFFDVITGLSGHDFWRVSANCPVSVIPAHRYHPLFIPGENTW